MKTLKNTMVVGGLALMLFAFNNIEIQSTEWVVPAEYEKMVNPTDAEDEENMEIGEELYMKHCKSCHGVEGLGDGPKAEEQEGEIGDFSTEEFQSQSDGALFYKASVGRDDMPAFDKKMPDEEDRWLVVNYMRTLGE